MHNIKFRATFASLFTRSTNGDSLAQLVEHNTFNVGVLGSSPRRITEGIGKVLQIAETKTVSAIFVMPYPAE